MTLLETFYKKIEIANDFHGITSFVFDFQGRTYYTEFIKNRWSDPVAVYVL